MQVRRWHKYEQDHAKGSHDGGPKALYTMREAEFTLCQKSTMAASSVLGSTPLGHDTSHPSFLVQVD
jgi:hypothetical protein